MEQENINEFIILGKKEVRRPCITMCRKISKHLRMYVASGAVGYVAGGQFGRGRRLRGAAVLVAGLTGIMRSLRLRIAQVCQNKCRIKALRVSMAETRDPERKRKITMLIAQYQTQIKLDSSYVNKRFADLKKKGRYAKLEKFETMWKQVQRM